MSQMNFKIIAKRYRYSIRFQYIIFPFTSSELMNALARTNLGYILSPPPKAGIPIGISLEAGGLIGKKGNTSIFFDSSLQVLAVEGLDYMETINVFSEIIDIIKSTLVPDSDKKVIFYEIISNHNVEIGQSSMKILGKQRFEGGLNESISKILGEEVSNYSIHMCSTSEKIDDPNWFDIQIQPFNRRPDVAFDVITVYRKSEKDMVDKFGKTLEDNLKKIFEFLSNA